MTTQTADGSGVDSGGTSSSAMAPVPGPSALAGALAAVQLELPEIAKGETADIETKSGRNIRYTYADLADITDAILPLLARNMLAWTCRPTLNANNRFVLAYELVHVSGENRTGEFPLPDGSIQQLGGYITYARRYCLCAVTGVQPRDDDTDARATATNQQQHSAEYDDAVAAVGGAWRHHFGGFDQDECAKLYGTWSKGRQLRQADAAELRRFAAYLSNLPAKDAGSDPAATGGESTEAGPEPITPAQRTKINAILSPLYGRDRAARLGALSALVGREIKSSSDLTKPEAHAAIEQLEANERDANGGADMDNLAAHLSEGR